MKNLKLFCIIFFCLGMIIVATQCNTEHSERQGSATPLPTNYEQRNLATPLSRLWGHWTSEMGAETYYSKVTKPGEEGTIVQVLPNSETWIKLIDKMIKNGKISEQKAKDELAQVARFAGKTTYSKFQLVSQEANGTMIIIRSEIEIPFTGTEEFELVLQVDKDGKKMKCVAYIMNKKSHPDNNPAIATFVDTKTTPEE